MKKALWLLFIFCSPLYAQRSVQVRLFSNQPPASVLIVPRGNTAIDGVSIKAATEISAARKPVRVTGAFTVEVSGSAPVRLEHPLTIGADGNRLRLLVTQPLEEYVAAVLAGEASTFQSPESLKAMAVAIRTFAVRFEGRHAAEGFDLCDTTHCQDFRMTAITDRLRSAVESTEGEILWFNGRPAATYYHQDCGGHTEDAASVWPGVRDAYLRGQPDTFCLAKGRSDWTTELTAEELKKAIGAATVEIVSRTQSGRVHQLRLTGGRNAVVNAEEFRLRIGRALGWNRVRSDHYQIRKAGDKYVFQGHGAGHGVGLCQAGAAQMGIAGRNYRDILAFYYPGTKLGINAQGLTWTRAGGERVELQTTRPELDRRIIPAADRIARQVEDELGRQLRSRPVIRIFPSVATYRDSTAEPGWVAASTRGSTIRLQPLETLGANAEKTLHHELMHILVEQQASPNLPRWFREGMVLALTEPAAAMTGPMRSPDAIDRSLIRPATREELVQAYAAAKMLVLQLISKHGKTTVLSWLETGLPSGVAQR